MASLYDIAVAIGSAQIYIFQIGGPILISIGILSCIINLLVFTQKTLRKNPCSIYFIAYNIANVLFIFSLLLSLTMSVGHNVDPAAYNLAICRLRLYAAVLFNCLSAFYLILAFIDRIFITSPNALTRQRSTLRLAYTCIIVGTLFWALLHCHVLILGSILQLGPYYFICYFQIGLYLTVVSYYLLMKELVGLLLMIILGVWAVNNVRRLGRVGTVTDVSTARTAASTTRTGVEGNSRSSSKDRQLVLMLLLDTTIYALFSLLYAIFLLYGQITQNYIKSAEQKAVESVITNLCLFGTCILYCTSCYSNLIVSKTFRKEVKKLFSWKRIFCIE